MFYQNQTTFYKKQLYFIFYFRL